jgi:hypothetical protein
MPARRDINLVLPAVHTGAPKLREKITIFYEFDTAAL